MKSKTIVRVLAAALMLVLLVPTFGALAESSPHKTLVVNTPHGGNLNLRTGPGTNYKVLDSFAKGTKVTLLKAGKDWDKVSVKGQIGYMFADYLKAYEPQHAVVINPNGGTFVNLRSGAGMEFKVLRKVPVNSHVVVLEKGKDWTKVEFDGVKGYMSSYFLKF
ncbi:hypothetical protein AGMMS49992_16130 [Clostridia bacterium]|nr:hypothetical protein AGMMS49992_16130 [Clostridia bacterium]